MLLSLLQILGSWLKDLLPFFFIKHEAEKAGKNEAENDILKETNSKLEADLQNANGDPHKPYDGDSNSLLNWLRKREAGNKKD